jgi:hypothetical protein
MGRAFSAIIIISSATWFFYWDNLIIQEILFRETETGKTGETGKNQKSKNMLLKVLLLRLGPLVILIIINFSLKLSGLFIITGFLGLVFHLLLDAMPYYIYISIIGYSIGHKKGNWYLAAWIQGIIFGWVMSASFPMAFLNVNL